MTNLPTPINIPLMDVQVFEQMQRVGSMLAMSPLFPEHLRKGDRQTAIANGVLVLNMAMRLNEDPLTVAQNIYFVGGKPGWSTSYLIAKANQHGVFADPIDWEITGDGDTLSVTATATIAKTGKEVSYTCDMKMAKAEGWTKNQKYSSMPRLMLRYRSATALIRLYCPEVMVGVPAQIEVETGGYEMRDITPRESQHAPETDIVETEDEPEPQPAKARKAKPADPVVHESDKARDDEPGKTSDVMDRAPAAAVDPEIVERLRGLASMIIGDLNDGASVEECRDLYGPQLDQMKSVSPDLFESVEAEFKAFSNADKN